MSSWTRIKVVFAIITLFISACGTAADPQPDTGGTDTGGTDTAGTDNTGTDTSGTGETTLQSIQELSAAMNCVGGDSPFLTHIEGLSLEGVVVVSPRFNAFTPEEEGNALDGYFVADQDGGTSAGALMVISRDLGTDFQIGDLLDIEGEAGEYYCMTQVSAALAVKVGEASVPAPVDVTSADFADGQTAEIHEGTLVRLQNVTGTEVLQYGETQLEGGAVIDDLFMYGELNLPLNETITEIVGVVNYSYGNYRICPRSADDVVGVEIVGGQSTTVTDIQQIQAGIDCSSGSGEEPMFTNLADGIMLTDVVVTSPRFVAYDGNGDESKALDGYFVADQAGGMYSGTQLVVSKSAATDYQIGDLLSVEGSATDFYCMTQVSADVATLTGQGEAPAPSLVTADTFATGAEIEKYEGTLVEIHNLVPSDEPNQWGEYDIDGVIVDDKFMFNDLNLTVGETISKLVGIVNYSYGKYMILPRSAADIEVAAPEATDP